MYEMEDRGQRTKHLFRTEKSQSPLGWEGESAQCSEKIKEEGAVRKARDVKHLPVGRRTLEGEGGGGQGKEGLSTPSSSQVARKPVSKKEAKKEAAKKKHHAQVGRGIAERGEPEGVGTPFAQAKKKIFGEKNPSGGPSRKNNGGKFQSPLLGRIPATHQGRMIAEQPQKGGRGRKNFSVKSQR